MITNAQLECVLVLGGQEKEHFSKLFYIVERTINDFASSRSVFFGNEAHETKSSVLHFRRTRYGSKQMSLRALYF